MAAFPERTRSLRPWGCWKNIERYRGVPFAAQKNLKAQSNTEKSRGAGNPTPFNLLQNAIVQLLLSPISRGLDEREYERVRLIGLGTELRLKQRGYKETVSG